MDEVTGSGRVEAGEELAARTYRRLSWAGSVSNGAGASVVLLALIFLGPGVADPDEYRTFVPRATAAFVVYAAISLSLGYLLIQRRPFAPIARWLRAGRPAVEEERLRVLGYPLNWTMWSALPWGVGSLLAALISLDLGPTNAIMAATTFALGGVTACALQYLVVERIMRPITARALAGGPPPRVPAPGVGARLTMAWTLATGVPLLGVVALVVADLAGANLDQERVAGATLFLASVALGAGLLAMVMAARSVADPIAAVGRAFERIEQGNFASRVAVEDGSEVGRLQAGFNHMADGLQEREQLRDAFGTFVDPSLTKRVLEEGTDLAGEEVELSVMFIDVRGFTAFAERAEAQEVVARLNDLYGLIVPIILRHGGHASKFIGDGLLAVFGAPERLDDHARHAVACAREIAEAVRDRYEDELRVGVGVNSGRVVAGTIGGGGRLDFTVIGDAVNTAARVEAATRETGDDVLITRGTLSLLGEDDDGWAERPPVRLKGKTEAVALFAPAN